ncbi:aldo/keto reductase family protein [Limosilactobacillus reuteri]|uniref:aldo/keto reductase family protein n=1 Tax=Limosilactobacillus reuteri TaxID=1598 RepID=UPI001E372150|nr:aldo/keto reductase family protein [Limosilactobacillus reuteri]MCC4383088.1 aldo/keto reductase family protein [Limosilactobacillus reuteri]MCC4418981.1 aldo/keto reductase family protein [Limosilactobacillus reuteri]
MKYRNVGKSGLKVSEIAIGSWMTELKNAKEIDVAKQVIQLAYENGINFFDCADAYSNGEAEKFLGNALKEYPRHKLVISSKVFYPTGDGINDRGLSRKHIFENIDRSLKNLQTDYLDLYYCHRFDESTPMEETLRAMSDLVRDGKILYYGVSEEWSAARIEKAERIIAEEHLYPLTVIQPQYNMIDRYIEHELINVCKDYGIGITSFSPLAQGLLTGKYKKNQPLPAGSRATHQADKQINHLLTDQNLDKVEQLSKIAKELNTNMAVLALAWILSHKEISSVITGASKPSQLANNLAAVNLTIPQDALDEIEKILGFHRFERHVG